MTLTIETMKHIAPNALDKTLENLADKPSKFLGTVLASALSICLSGIVYKAKKVDYKRKLEYCKWIEEISEKLDTIPQEKRRDPPLQIAEPLVNSLAACIDEPKLSEMFSNLLKSSCDKDKLHCVHPAFPDIIRQLSQLDAEILSTFKEKDIQALVDYRNQDEDGTGKTIKSNVYYIDFKSYENFDLNASSITNLIRLGLLTRNERSLIDDSEYLRFENDPWLSSLKEVCESNNDLYPFSDVVVEKRIVQITPFGIDFLNACYE